jgi:hypothetical protein
MSKRLQVLFEDAELREIRRAARAKGATVAHWVRSALRQARQSESGGDAGKKLAAIRRAAKYSFPTADIEQMNREVEAGFLTETAS